MALGVGAAETSVGCGLVEAAALRVVASLPESCLISDGVALSVLAIAAVVAGAFEEVVVRSCVLESGRAI